MCYYYSTQQSIERFDTSHLYICAGDSILNNANYVSPNQSVVDQLSNKLNVYNVAQDNASISGVLNQIDQVPLKYLNHDNISVILSVGGNDLLQGGDITVVYPKYAMLVKDIVQNHIKGSGKVYVTSLYYPRDKEFAIFYPIISQWNHQQQQLSRYDRIQVVDISNIKEESDFSNKIEPSEIGGTKIVGSIVDSI
jgi:lysophospholipase L1-like esterase